MKKSAGQIGDGNGLGVGDWRFSFAGIDPSNPTRPAPPPQSGGVSGVTSPNPVRYLTGVYGNGSPASVFDAGTTPTPWLHPIDIQSPDRSASFGDRFIKWSPSLPSGSVSLPPPAPAPPQGLLGRIVDHIRQQNEQAAGKPPASVFDTGAPPVPFVPDDSESSFADRFGDRPPVHRLTRRYQR